MTRASLPWNQLVTRMSNERKVSIVHETWNLNAQWAYMKAMGP